MSRLFLSLFCLTWLAVQTAPAQTNNSLAPTGPASISPAAPTGGQKPDNTGLGGLGKERPKDAKTEITAKNDATFDNAANVAEFEGSVVVKDPQFTLFCDKLRVTLNKDRKGMQLAEATGNVIIVQESKDDATGKVTKATGRSGKAIYEPQSGNITLTIWPSMQHDRNMQIATEASTVMILNRSGISKTTGGSRTTIVESADQSGDQPKP